MSPSEEPTTTSVVIVGYNKGKPFFTPHAHNGFVTALSLSLLLHTLEAMPRIGYAGIGRFQPLSHRGSVHWGLAWFALSRQSVYLAS